MWTMSSTRQRYPVSSAAQAGCRLDQSLMKAIADNPIPYFTIAAANFEGPAPEHGHTERGINREAEGGEVDADDRTT